MQTSRFQLGLMATLAVGLGFSLSSSDAIGYPSGAAVSMGSNPVWNWSENIPNNTTLNVVTAPSDQDVMITDIAAITSGSWFTLQLDDGTRLMYHQQDATSERLDRQYKSPLMVPAGSTLSITNCNCGPEIAFTLSGYYAQP